MQCSVCELIIPAYSFINTPVKNFKKSGFGHLSIKPVSRTIVMADNWILIGIETKDITGLTVRIKKRCSNKCNYA